MIEHPSKHEFDSAWAAASGKLDARPPSSDDQTARVELWRKQEFHNWLRWRICKKGFDWSKPGVILLNAVGFISLLIYGLQTGKLYVTAGGVVAWFTIVNLSFFTYFGLTLPGPPLAHAEPLAKKGERFRAEMGLYPPNYERRKLARIWLKLSGHKFELACARLPGPLEKLMLAQQQFRMQRGAAPVTQAVVEAAGAAREQLNQAAAPFEIVAWR